MPKHYLVVSCEIRKTKNWLHRNIGILLYAFALSLFISLNAIAEDNSENDIQYWLTEAEKYARRIEDTEERNWALSLLAVTYADAGIFTKAYLIVKQLPFNDQGICLRSIVMAQTLQGDAAGALERIQNICEPEIKSSCLYTIAYVCVKNDISQSLNIAAQMSEPSKSSILRRIVGQYVLKGDIDKANHVAQQISDPNEKIDAQLWITAANISNAEDVAKAIAQINPYPWELNYHLREIAKVKLQSDQIKIAKQIIESLPDSHNKIIGYCVIAEYYLAKDDKEIFNRYIKKAKKEIQHYSEEPEFNSFNQALSYIQIAKLQIDAGDIEAGLATAKISLEKGKKNEFKALGINLYNDLGGRNAAYGLMIQAGKIEEVRKLTQGEDGSFPREVAILLIGAYARAGQDDKAEEIVNTITTPQDKFHLSLAVIQGLNQRKANDKQQQQKP